MCVRCTPTSSLTRRRALGLFAAAAAAPALSGCDQIAALVVSDADIAALGSETWTRLKAERPASRDENARRTASDVAGRLLQAAGERPREWELEVFAGPTVNAFALPGRKIGLFDGMVRVAGGEGGLAAVIGHEIGHVQAAHAAERITAEMARQWGLQLIYYLLEINDVDFAREIAGLLGIGAEFGLVRPYGRRQELEADRLGVFTMARAGFDPHEAVGLWQRMEEASTGAPPQFLSTHPAPRARIEAIEAMIPEALRELPG